MIAAGVVVKLALVARSAVERPLMFLREELFSQSAGG